MPPVFTVRSAQHTMTSVVHTISRVVIAVAMTGITIGAHAGVLHAQQAPVVQLLAPGVEYRRLTDPRGPWTTYVLKIDLKRADIELRPARAKADLRGRERTTSMVARAKADGADVLAAVNADFFDLKTGENENNQVINGEWWKGLKVTDSPYDTYDNVHVQFAIDAKRRPTIDRFLLDGKAWVRGVMTPIINVNAKPTGTQEGTTLYTARYGASTPRDSVRDTTRVNAEAMLIAAGRRGDTTLYVRRGAVSNAQGTSIPADGAVLAAFGARTKEIDAMREGDTVRVLLTTLPRLQNDAAPTQLLGGWPQILRNGVNIAGDAATVEGTISRNAEARHPRTAIGYSRDGKTLWIFAVDGRKATSVGMTLTEMADVMRALGVWNAMNFDGGGSTTVVIGGAVVNAPSDATGEREVGNALMVVRRH